MEENEKQLKIALSATQKTVKKANIYQTFN